MILRIVAIILLLSSPCMAMMPMLGKPAIPTFSCTDTDADLFYEPFSVDGAKCSGWTTDESGSSTYEDDYDVSADSPCATEDYSSRLQSVGDGASQAYHNFTASNNVYIRFWIKLISEGLSNGDATGPIDVWSTDYGDRQFRIYLTQGTGSSPFSACASGNICTYAAYRNSATTTVQSYPSSPTTLSTGTWYYWEIEWNKSSEIARYWIDGTLQLTISGVTLHPDDIDRLLTQSSGSKVVNLAIKDIRIDSTSMPTGCTE